MFNIEILKSNPCDQWLVRQFEAYRFSSDSVTDRFIPRPYISVVFHFKDCPAIDGETPLQLDTFFAAPIVPQAFLLKFQGTMDTLAITCKATVLSRLFKLDMSPTPQRSIPLSGPNFFGLWKRMADLGSTRERIACFSDFIHSLQQTPYRPDAVDMLYDKIIEKSIHTPVKEIMRECNASKSTLLRKFISRTGVHPKTLARIVRIDYLWTRIRDEQAVDYQELVVDGNYFDQSHFINDFRDIIGETPGYFFNRNLDIVRKFSAKPLARV